MSERCRFVVLAHDHPVLHWDLMLDRGDTLRTWRLEQEPQAGVDVVAVAIADHRRAYLDYEGPVSGGRGSVVRWDAGTFSELEESAERVAARFQGDRIRGTVSWMRGGEEDWIFIWEPAKPQSCETASGAGG